MTQHHNDGASNFLATGSVIEDRNHDRQAREPIAIVGIGCRFPGGVDSPESFWKLLREGVDAITDIPVDRTELLALYDPTPATPGKISAKQGGFLSNLDKFDPYFFGISPREAAYIDPQQRLLLEVTWEAFEDAGIPPHKYSGSRTGVFVGMWTNEYEDLMQDATSNYDLYITTGGGRYSASGRLSYLFDFQGPSMTLDTACSSSLAAIHLSCHSLRNHESDLCLAAGVNLILKPYISVGYSRSKMLSPDARCKFGDVSANGYVRSEGAGVVLLKRLSDALRDGDPIYALVRGSAVNNDGQSSGLLVAPGVKTQEDMLWQAYRDAGVDPSLVQYLEAHGTGTSVGDPVEMQAMGAVVSKGRHPLRPCLVGSVKTNIGHSEAASGIAGLIKLALCLKHGVIVPSLHFKNPNPAIAWQDLGLKVQTELVQWTSHDGPALGGVNSFGVTGTNAHVVLEQAPVPLTRDQLPVDSEQSSPQFLCISAKSESALRALAAKYEQFLTQTRAFSLRDVCFSAATGRSHLAFRMAAVAKNADEMREALRAFMGGEKRAGMASGHKGSDEKRKIVFVFPGQGSQWLGMARGLLEREPAFRDSMQLCDEALKKYVDWPLLEQLSAEEDSSSYRLNQIDVIQPTLFSIQVSLAALWRSWGIEPDAVVGHSMGEVAATHVAGALSLDDAARIICRRSHLLRRTSGKGAMAVVELSIDEAQKALHGHESKLSIAVSNSSRSTVLSGDPTALDQVIAELEKQEVFWRRIKVDVASHSPQMDPLREDLLQAITGIQPRVASVPIYSTVKGSMVEGAELNENYWVHNLRQPVLFSNMVRKLNEDGHEIFIEISAHPLLLPAIQQELQSLGKEVSVLPSMRRDEDEQLVMLESLGGLYAQGYPVDWQRLYPNGGHYASLPHYPWQRERFWITDATTSTSSLLSRRNGNAGHPFLGQQLRSSIDAGMHFWETELSTLHLPYLEDHRVNGAVILPASAYLEFALATAAATFGEGAHAVEKVGFKEALFLSKDKVTTVQVVLSQDFAGLVSFQLLSLASEDKTASSRTWTLHASGTIRLNHKVQAPALESPQRIRERCTISFTSAEHYAEMARRGLQYGPNFQGIAELWQQNGECLGKISVPEALVTELNAYKIHPSILDACFQLLEACVAGSDTFLPVSLECLRLYDRANAEKGLWGYVLRNSNGKAVADSITGDVFLLDDEGRLLAEARGLCLQRLARDTEREINDLFYHVEWQPRSEVHQAATEVDARGKWLILADRHNVGKRICDSLKVRGADCIVVTAGESFKRIRADQYVLNPQRPEEFTRLIAEITGDAQPSWRGIVHLWSLNTSSTNDDKLVEAQDLGCISVLHMIQALAQAELEPSPRLYLITSGVHLVQERSSQQSNNPLIQQSINPAIHRSNNPLIQQSINPSILQSTLWGLGAVIANEHPEFKCTRVDLSAAIDEHELKGLCDEILAADAEDQIVLRDNARFVARLRRWSEVLEGAGAVQQQPMRATSEQSFRAEITTPGILDGIVLRAFNRTQPGLGQVEIEVRATGLNFMNIMSALGTLPGYEKGVGPLGIECSGKISAIGKGVEGFQIGDEVIAFAFDCLATHALAEAKLVAPKPAYLDFDEAATIPIVFLTAYYALHHLGRMAAGERVLIHAAAGGVGLAAIQLAQGAGAEVYATAGTPEKRDYLKSIGVRHVMDSRSLAFAGEVMELTRGEGVDLVLNSLAGEAIGASLSTLRPYGRFLEIGKRDIYQNSKLGLQPFQKNLSYFAIDLDRMARERPRQLGTLIREVVQMFVNRELNPIPKQVFPVARTVEAFRHMALAKHIGKVLVSLAEREVEILPAVHAHTCMPSDGTYLITGGLGGLGLLVAQWLVKQGARHLVLVGRSGAGEEAQVAIAEMEKTGTKVTVAQADVSDEKQVAALITEVKESLPPLKGIVHAAGLLADNTLLQMDRARFFSALAPKVQGAWNLHQHTLNLPLDFFVMFSSVAATLGTTGQGNYAAGNAFLDALAHYRRSHGLSAMSINWGPWSRIGLAAAQANRGQRLESRGLGSIEPKEGIAALQKAFELTLPQVAVMRFDATQWRQFHPHAAQLPFFAELTAGTQSEVATNGKAENGAVDFREQLLAAEPGRKRRSLFETHLRDHVAQVLKLAPGRIPLDKPLRTLGLDSLMALELRNRLEASLKITLPATTLFNYPTIELLTNHLAGRMEVPMEMQEKMQKIEKPQELKKPAGILTFEDTQSIDKILDELEQLSEEDARKILAE